VRLSVRGRGVGRLLVVRGPGRPPFEAGELALLERVAAQSSVQLDAALAYERDHDLAVTLQRNLLPLALPDTPGLEVRARYRPAAEGLEAGGDWYEAVLMPDGRVMLSVGDVVGKGTRAAAAMGQLRSAVRAYALRGLGPGEALRALDSFAALLPDARASSGVCASVDPRTGRVEYACAGHPWPLLAGPGRRTRILPGGRAGLLGEWRAPVPTGTVVLRPGDTLILLTDGLVERRAMPLDQGFERLMSASAQIAELAPDLFCDALLDAVDAGSATDDVALLIARLG
jgi:serine phosphatase RsbU (regulator of sigma subunit)